MGNNLSDEEAICTFMEPRPADERFNDHLRTDGWWKHKWSVPNQVYRAWPNDDKVGSLDALWEVEERLTDEQWDRYEDVINCHDSPRGYLHATPEQKIKALAAVLRPLVQPC